MKRKQKGRHLTQSVTIVRADVRESGSEPDTEIHKPTELTTVTAVTIWGKLGS